MENGVFIVTARFTLFNKKTVIINASNGRYHAFGEKNKNWYGTVSGDPLKQYAPKKITLRFDSVRKGKVRVTNSDALL